MDFKVGDKVVVPTLGVGVVREIVDENIGGDAYRLYDIKILDNGSTFQVSPEMAEENGVREVMLTSMIDEVYAVLRDREKPADKQTWNRRYREYMNKIKTGDPLEVAAVLRDLAILKSEKQLSFGERKMYDQAHGLIVQEIAVARDDDEDDVKDELEQLFKEADAAMSGDAKPVRKSKKKKKVADADDGDDNDNDDDDEETDD